jgi:hypothetical protein
LPTKKPTKLDLLAVARCPVPIVEAFNALSTYGVDQVGLCRLIRNRKKTKGGAPNKNEEMARLHWSVSQYQEEHPGTKLREAIRKVLEYDGVMAYVYDEKLKKAVLKRPESDYLKYSNSEKAAAVHRLATALTRFRKQLSHKTPA